MLLVAMSQVLASFTGSSYLFKLLMTPLIGAKQVYLWKRAFSFFCGNFCTFALLRWNCFQLGLINTEVEKDDSTSPSKAKAAFSPGKTKKNKKIE